MNSLTAFAAAVSSATNANASAGIFNYNTSVKSEKPKISLSQVKRSHSDECASSPDSHQIGTNLVEQSVCWHRVPLSDNCQKCGHPFYEGKRKNYNRLLFRLSIFAEDLKKFGHQLDKSFLRLNVEC